ncbi:MAG: DMT family transporter, partial [Propionivibrio sp.]
PKRTVRPYFSATGDTLFGDALILGGSLCWGFYTVLATRWGYSGWTLTRAIAFGSAVVYLPVYFFLLPKQLAAAPVSMIVIQAVFQGVIATIVAMVTYLKAISILGPERAVVFLALVPIVTGIIAVPLLDEALTGWLLAGLVFVSLGSFVASRYGASKARLASTAVVSTPVGD